MEREYLLKTLELVAPALSTNTLIPVLQHFWFTGKRVMAYNDTIAISTPLETPFAGAVPGVTLLDLLRTISATELTLQTDKDILSIKVGTRGHYKLGLMTPDKYESLFSMPKFGATDISGTKGFMSGISNCIRSVSTDTSVREQLGITVISIEGGLHLYATNNATLAHSRVSQQATVKFTRVILSGPFCEQMIKLSEQSGKHLVSISTDHAMFSADQTLLFGRLIEPASTELDFAGVLKHHLPKDYKADLWPIPKKMTEIIDRACIVTSATIDKTRTHINLNGKDMLQFFSKSERGEARDNLRAPDTQDAVEINIDPVLLKSGLDYKKVLFTNECVIFTDEDHRHLYLVGASKR